MNPFEPENKKYTESADALRAELMSAFQAKGLKAEIPENSWTKRFFVCGGTESVGVEVSEWYRRGGWNARYKGVEVKYDCVSSRGASWRDGFRSKTLIKKDDAKHDVQKIVADVIATLDHKIALRKRNEEAEALSKNLTELTEQELPDPKRVFTTRQRRPDGTYRIVLTAYVSLAKAKAIQQILSEP